VQFTRKYIFVRTVQFGLALFVKTEEMPYVDFFAGRSVTEPLAQGPGIMNQLGNALTGTPEKVVGER